MDERTAAEAGFEDVAQLNRAIGDRLGAAKFLEDLNGQTLKGGRLMKYVFQGIGSTLGNSIPGKILGALGGDIVAQIMISGSVSNPVKRMILNSIKDTEPAVHAATIKWLTDQGVMRGMRLALPAPDPTRSVINQGRAIPVLPKGGSIEPLGKDVVAGRYTPPNAAPTGKVKPLLYDEQYTAAKNLPIIKMGPKAQSGAPGVPVLRYGASNPAVARGAAGPEAAKVAPVAKTRPGAVSGQPAGGTITRYSEKPVGVTREMGYSVAKQIENHLASGKQVLENLSADKLKAMGGMTDLLKRIQTNIVDDLAANGQKATADIIRKIDVKKFKTISEIEAAIRQAMGKTSVPIPAR